MKSRYVRWPRLLVIALVVLSSQAMATTHSNVAVQVVQPSNKAPAPECLYFTLIGVNVADSAVPGGAWFAVPKTQQGYSEIFATLLTAKAAGLPITVVTTGGSVCNGYAEVQGLYLN